MPLKAIYDHGPKRSLPPTGKEPYACKKPAYWTFKALKASYAKDGTYCMSHLFSQMNYMGEDGRVERWAKRRYGSMEAWYESLGIIVEENNEIV